MSSPFIREFHGIRGTLWHVPACKVRDPKYIEEAANWMRRTGFGARRGLFTDAAYIAPQKVSPPAVPKSLRISRNELLPDKL